jgi:hypothetical protein
MNIANIPSELLLIVGKFIANIDKNALHTWLILMGIVETEPNISFICVGILSNIKQYIHLVDTIPRQMKTYIKNLSVTPEELMKKNTWTLTEFESLNKLCIRGDKLPNVPVVILAETLLSTTVSKIKLMHYVSIIFNKNFPQLEKLSTYLFPENISMCTNLKEIKIIKPRERYRLQRNGKRCNDNPRIIVGKNIFPRSIVYLSLYHKGSRFKFNLKTDDFISYRCVSDGWYWSNDSTCGYHLRNHWYEYCTCSPSLEHS